MAKLKNTEIQKKILTLVNEGLSNEEIGRKIGVTGSAIRYFLIKNKKNRTWRKWEYDESFFEEVNSPEKVYFLGWLASDGYINKTYTTAGITLQDRDIDVLIKLKKLIKSTRPLWFRKKHTEKSRDTFSLFLSSTKICNDLKFIGILNNKSENISIPPIIPDHLIKFFIRGFFEGDGTIYFNKKGTNVTFYSISKKISEQILNICNSKVENCFRIKVSNREGFKTCYHVTCSHRNNAIKFLNWLYSDLENLLLERKYKKYLELKALATLI